MDLPFIDLPFFDPVTLFQGNFEIFLYNKLLKIDRLFCERLDELERERDLTKVKAKIPLGKRLRKLCKKQGINSDSLRLKMASLRYRTGDLKKVEPDKDLVEQLCNLVPFWKKRLLPRGQDTACTPKDEEKIKNLCSYPKIAKVLVNNTHFRDEFFKLVLRDHFPIDVLIQYVHLTSVELKQVHITPWIGYFFKYGHQLLTVEENGDKKDLRLLINGRRVSILNTKESIDVGAKTPLTWQEVLQIWRRGIEQPTEMAFFADRGMISWRSQGLYYPTPDVDIKKQGWWKEASRIDTTKEGWWNDPNLPIFLIMDQSTVEELVEIAIDPAKPYISAISGSCLKIGAIEDTHGYVMLFMPIGEGKYRLYPLGKYASFFPHTWLQMLLFIANTVPAEPTYPDPSPGMSYRLHGATPKAMTQGQAEELLRKFGKEIWYFQWGGNNCSEDIQNFHNEIFEENENYYRTPGDEVQTATLALKIFSLMALFPRPLYAILFRRFLFLLGSWRTLTRSTGEKVSLAAHPYFQKAEIYIPGRLVKSILDGERNGVVYYGGYRLPKTRE